MTNTYNRVLILGGTGFLGYHTLRALDSAGFQLAIMLHRKKDDLSIPFEGYELYTGDVLKPETLQKVIDEFRPEVIVNMVGSLSQNPKKIFVDSMKNIVEVAQRGGVKKIVYVSDLAVKNVSNTRYLEARREAEEVLKNSTLDWTIFRPTAMFGWRASFTNVFIKQIERFGPILVPSDRFRLQPVAATTTSFCITRAVSGDIGNSKIYEVVGPEVLTPNQIVQRLKLALNSQRTVWYVPFFLLKLLVLLKKIGWPTKVTRFHLHVFQNRALGNADAIKQDLGVKEVKFDPASESPLY